MNEGTGRVPFFSRKRGTMRETVSHSWRWRGRKVWMSLLASAVLIAALGTLALASIPDPDGTIHACYTKAGTLRVIDADTQTCIPSETELTWNQEGPQGPEGPEGPPGSQDVNLVGSTFGWGASPGDPADQEILNFGGLILNATCNEAGILLEVDTDVPGGPILQFVGANDGAPLHIRDASLAIGEDVVIPVGSGATTGTFSFGVGTSSLSGVGRQVSATLQAWGGGQAFGGQDCVIQGIAWREPDPPEE